MNIVSKKTLKEFYIIHKESEIALKLWYSQVIKEEWNTPHDIKSIYPHASFINDNRVIFNIKGNEFRLVTHIDYLRKIVRIKFIGTHAAYDKINAATIKDTK